MAFASLVGLALTATYGPVHATLRNSDFAAGLQGWKAAWHVSAAAGEAVLSDEQAFHAFLFQADSPGTGDAVVAFDFRAELSLAVPVGALMDSFYASVYYVDDLARFITEHDQFDDHHGLLDLDANGPFNVNGTITNSPKGEGWSRFTGLVTASHTYVVIIFELYDMNFTAGDSAVQVDNVTVEQSPP